MSQRRVVPIALLLLVLSSPSADASIAPRTVPPPTVSSPRNWNGDPDMPEGYDPRQRPVDTLDARTAPLSTWLTFLRELGFAFGI